MIQDHPQGLHGPADGLNITVGVWRMNFSDSQVKCGEGSTLSVIINWANPFEGKGTVAS